MQRRPVRHRPADRPTARSRQPLGRETGAPEDERPGVRGIGQDVVHRRFGGQLPEQLAGMHPTGLATRRQRRRVAKTVQHLLATAQGGKRREDQLDGVADPRIRVQDHPPVRAPDQPRRQVLAIRPLGDLPLAAGGEAVALKVPCGLAEHALQAEQQPVVVEPWVEDAIAVGNECADQGRKVQQAIPVGVIPCEAARLEGEHEPHVPERDLGDQRLEPRAGAIATRLAQVVVDRPDAGGGPAQRDRTLHEGILVRLAGQVLPDLPGRGLADGDHGLPLAVPRRDFLSRRPGHGPPPGAA